VSDAPAPPPLIEYPAPYPFKVFGKLEPGFREYVRVLFGTLLGIEVDDQAIEENVSTKSTYVALTITVVLTDEAQRQRIYEHLKADRRVVYYL
jgi:putative lipoic acid-binding regulatory protein